MKKSVISFVIVTIIVIAIVAVSSLVTKEMSYKQQVATPALIIIVIASIFAIMGGDFFYFALTCVLSISLGSFAGTFINSAVATATIAGIFAIISSLATIGANKFLRSNPISEIKKTIGKIFVTATLFSAIVATIVYYGPRYFTMWV